MTTEQTTVRTAWFTCAQLAFGMASAFTAGCGASMPGSKPASTLTLVSAVDEKVEDGTIEIKGKTDNAPPP